MSRSRSARRSPGTGARTRSGCVHGENDGLPGPGRRPSTTRRPSSRRTPRPGCPTFAQSSVASRRPLRERVVLRLGRGAGADGAGVRPGRRSSASCRASRCRSGRPGCRSRPTSCAARRPGTSWTSGTTGSASAALAGGADVLDVFACTGGFSVHAAAGGARDGAQRRPERPGAGHGAAQHGAATREAAGDAPRRRGRRRVRGAGRPRPAPAGASTSSSSIRRRSPTASPRSRAALACVHPPDRARRGARGAGRHARPGVVLEPDHRPRTSTPPSSGRRGPPAARCGYANGPATRPTTRSASPRVRT